MDVTGAYLLQAIGILGTNKAHWLDITVSGFAVGAGTKPLHDLISIASKASDSASTPNAATPAANS
jgi:hypothetical protein